MSRTTYGPWVPAYQSLMRGKRKAVSRAARFLFLELCMAARNAGSDVVELRPDMDTFAGVADELGGTAEEVGPLLGELEDDGLIEIREFDIRIPSMVTHSLGDGALRMHRARARKSNVTLCDANDVTPRDVNGAHPVRDMRHLEKSREEKIRGDTRASAPETPPHPGTEEVETEAAKAAELWASVRVTPTASRIAAAIANDDVAKASKVGAPAVVARAVLKVREWSAAHPDATAEQRLARLETAVGWVLDDGRKAWAERARVAAAPPERQTGGKIPVYVEPPPQLTPDQRRAHAKAVADAARAIGMGGRPFAPPKAQGDPVAGAGGAIPEATDAGGMP